MLKPFIILQLCFSIAFGISISGVVSDSTNGSSLIGANVILKGTSFGAATNTDGRYSIDKVPIGDYTLSSSYLGFKSFEKKLSIQDQQNISINNYCEFIKPKNILFKDKAFIGKNSFFSAKLLIFK